MNKRKMLGLLFIAGGAGLMFVSNYISGEVNQGRAQIEQGQKQLNTVDTVFSSNSYTRGIGQTVTESGQKKINAGILEADYYAGVAGKCRIAGIASIIFGAFLFLFPTRRKA